MMSNYKTSERALRKLRQNIFNYDGEKEAQADRILGYLKKRTMRDRGAGGAGIYSGLTRAELAATGTVETDWY